MEGERDSSPSASTSNTTNVARVLADLESLLIFNSASSGSRSYLPSMIIPGLPNDLACLCLAHVPLWTHRRLRVVCRAWNAALSGRFIYDLRRRCGLCEEFLCLFRDDPSLTPGEMFDPREQVWSLLPPMPCSPYRYGLTNFECVAAGPNLFVIGGSLFDARSFPMDTPLASASVFRFDSTRSQWDRLADMNAARGSFACGVCGDEVYVAGGGSRHAQFAAGGSRLASVERYDMGQNRWEIVEDLDKVRAGCVGFFVGNEFWVMGGYGSSRTISGILPVDDYYNDGQVLNVNTGKWRELAPMWEDGERRRLGKVAVLNGSKHGQPGIFMLDNSILFRYDISQNRWFHESDLPRTVLGDFTCCVVALDGELYVIPGGPFADPPGRRLRSKKRGSIVFQIYNPRTKSWRLLATKPLLDHKLRIPWGAMCVISL